MPVRYRRPDPSSVVAARARLVRLTGGSGGADSMLVPSLPVADVVPPSHPRSDPARPGAVSEPTATEVPVPGSTPTGLPVPPGPAAPAGAVAVAEPPALAESDAFRRVREICGGWVERAVPLAFKGARLDPGWPGVAALAVVAVLAAALAGYVVWRARPHAVAVTAPPTTRAGPAVAPSVGPVVVVAVAGGVRRPGLVTLPSGSRVADALRAAGGVRPGIDVGLLNLARRLVDGEQVVVGASAPPLPGSPVSAGGTLNLNTATVEQLDALPGVGPVLASRIASYRTQHGAFRSVDQLREVSGIGEAKFADLRPLVSV